MTVLFRLRNGTKGYISKAVLCNYLVISRFAKQFCMLLNIYNSLILNNPLKKTNLVLLFLFSTEAPEK